jgi:hypothetical protein
LDNRSNENNNHIESKNSLSLKVQKLEHSDLSSLEKIFLFSEEVSKGSGGEEAEEEAPKVERWLPFVACDSSEEEEQSSSDASDSKHVFRALSDSQEFVSR